MASPVAVLSKAYTCSRLLLGSRV